MPYISSISVATPLTSLLGGDVVQVELQFVPWTKFTTFDEVIDNKYTITPSFGSVDGSLRFAPRNVSIVDYKLNVGAMVFRFVTSPGIAVVCLQGLRGRALHF